MASKKWSLVFAVIAILLVLGGIAFLIIRDYPRIEGFAAAILDTPKCPDRYTFFNDKRGDSFCCAGQVDPYSHTCKGNGRNDLCAMKPNMKDTRRNAKHHDTLPMCSDMISKTHNKNQAACPGSLPNYASIGKCCMARPDLDGYDCRKQDNADKKRYCKISPPLLPGEQLCSNLQMAAAASCPTGFAKMTYQLGDREVEKYGKAASGVQMPICFGMDKTCIPDTIVKDLQSKGVYKDKSIDTWAYSCTGWDTVNVKRDLTKKMDNAYM